MNHPVVQFLQAFVFVSFAATVLSAWCIPEKWLRPWMMMLPGGAFIGSLGLYAIAFMCGCAK